MSYSDEYVPFRKYSYTEYSTEEQTDEELETLENYDLDFLHSVFELEQEIQKYRKDYHVQIGDKINADNLLNYLQGKLK
jgi:hypothetical protein